MSSEQNRFITLIICVAASVLGLGWFYANRAPVVHDTLQEAPLHTGSKVSGEAEGSTLREALTDLGVSTSTWTSYANEKYGFFIRYPRAFQLVEKDVGDILLPGLPYKAAQYSLDIGGPRTKISYFDLTIVKTTSSIYDYLNDSEGRPPPSKRTLNSIDGFESYGYGSEGHVYDDVFGFKHGDLAMLLDLDPVLEGRISESEYPGSGGSNDYNPSKDPAVYREILSSFRVVR